jgi:large subunit ribosomal protein L30
MEKKKINETKLIVVIRIKGLVKVKSDITNTLDRLRLKRKYSCSLVDSENKDLIGMLKKVKHYVAYGPISKEILTELIKNRAKKIDKKEFKAEEVTAHLISGKTLNELGFKSFFRLHPPRKGIKSKLQYPKGVLGDNKEDINKLIERML